MFARIRNIFAAVLAGVLSTAAMNAQTDGTYGGFSPYSVFAVGQMHQSGTTWNRGMGGVGIAARNHRFVNIMNPASVTARDSLSFMADFGLNGRTSIFHEGDKKALNTTLNLDDFVISFPLWKHTAMMVGLTPLSDVGYNISYTEMDVYTNQRVFSSSGNGGLYQVFGAFSATLWRRLSLGVQANYAFGNISKKASLVSADDAYMSIVSGDSLQVNTFNVKLGLQYEQPVGVGKYITLGATYKFSSPMHGHSAHYRELGSYYRKREQADLGSEGLMMGNEIGVGLSYRNGDDFLVEADYTRSDWTNSRMDRVKGFSNVGDAVFAPGVGQSFNAGVEFTPRRSDVRYFFRRCTYRGGVFFDQSYYTVDGAPVNSIGVTIGMTLPVYAGYNGVSIGLQAGTRGLATSQVRENFLGFNLGFNIFDIWFRKRAYE